LSDDPASHRSVGLHSARDAFYANRDINFSHAHIDTLYQEAPRELPHLFNTRLNQINRKRAAETLKLLVSDARFERRSKPLVVILLGGREDDLPAFIDRFGTAEFLEAAGSGATVISDLEWPDLSFRTLIATVRSRLTDGKPVAVARQQEEAHLSRLISSHPSSLCLGMTILDVGGCLGRPEVLEDWRRFFTQVCGHPRGKSVAMVLLAVQMQDPPSDACLALKARLEAFNTDRQFEVLPIDQDVVPGDLERWITAYNRAPTFTGVQTIYHDIIPRVFRQDASLPFREAWRRLHEEITRDYHGDLRSAPPMRSKRSFSHP
jgi:hypothetical protein